MGLVDWLAVRHYQKTYPVRYEKWPNSAVLSKWRRTMLKHIREIIPYMFDVDTNLREKQSWSGPQDQNLRKRRVVSYDKRGSNRFGESPEKKRPE